MAKSRSTGAQTQRLDARSRACPGAMEDDTIHGRIEELVTEEHELWQREAAGDAERRRLAELRVTLDQCWDLVRQRRALHEAGLDEDAARVREAEVVERYQQ